MRNKTEIKRGLFEALKSTVNTIFWKRGFKDNFSEEEMEQIKEVNAFLYEICGFKGEDILRPFYKGQYFFLCFKATITVSGEEISVFYNKAIPVKELDYEKIEYYVAKAILRCSQRRLIEVYYTPNNFRPLQCGYNTYMVERKNANASYANSVYMDIDLQGELAAMSDDEIMEYLKMKYRGFFAMLPPTYILRSGLRNPRILLIG